MKGKVLVVAALVGGLLMGTFTKAPQVGTQEVSTAVGQELRDQQEAKRQAEAAAERQARHDECQESMAGLASALQDVDSRLSIGLNVATYSEKVGDAVVAWDAADPNSTTDACPDSVTEPLRLALNAFIRAGAQWDNCIWDFDCSLDGAVERSLQTRWARATEYLQQYEDGLAAMLPEATLL